MKRKPRFDVAAALQHRYPIHRYASPKFRFEPDAVTQMRWRRELPKLYEPTFLTGVTK